MQSATQLNTSQELKQGQVSERVEEIIAKHIPAETNSKLIKKQIFAAIEWDKKGALFLLQKFKVDLFNILPESLRNDEDILLAMLTEKPEMFESLSDANKKKPKLQAIVFKELLEKKASIFLVIQVLMCVSEKQRMKFEKKMDKAIANEYSFGGILSELYYKMYKGNRKLYKIISEKRLFEINSLWIEPSKWFIKFLTQELWSREEQWESEQEDLLQLLYNFLWIDASDIQWDSKNFFQEFLKWISLPNNRKEEKSEDEATKKEEENKSDAWEVPWDEDSLLSKYESIGPYSFSRYGACANVWDIAGNSVSLDTVVLEKMSEKWISNYMTFSRMMNRIWLSFLIEKHARLIQVVTDVSFYEGEGMSESRILKFLNNIGKNIWIPENSYQDMEGNKKIGCFNDLWGAETSFLEVKSSWKLTNFYIDPSKKGDKSIVEHYMKDSWLTTEPFGEISVSSWNTPRWRVSETTLLAA